MITNQEWWKEQAEANLKPLERAEAKYLNKLKGTFGRTSKKITEQINAFYAKYDNPTYAQATQYLPPVEAQDVQEEALEQADNVYRGNAAIKKDLETLGNKPRLNRLDALIVAITVLYVRQGNVQNRGMDDVLGATLADQYTRSLWTLGRGQGFSKVFKPMSDSRINAILKQPWSGENYSTRLWGNTKRIADLTKQTLTEGLIRGDSTQQMAKIIQVKAQSSYSAAERLVRTEMTRISTEGDMQAYKDAGIKNYIYLATLDDRTSEICQQLDGQKFKLEDKQEGTNAPPMHPNCRSTTIADVGTTNQMQRRAKDAEGNSILVDGDMTYEQYKKEILDAPKPATEKPLDPIKQFEFDNNFTKTDVENLLSYDEANALTNYTDFNYAKNSQLRDQALGEQVYFSDKDMQYFNDMDSALSKGVLGSDANVYRAANFDDDMLKSLIQDNTFTDAGYMSTTLSKDLASEYAGTDVIFDIQLPAGTNGMYLEGITATQGEFEFLLPRNTTLDIVDINYGGNEATTIVKAVIKDG